MYGLRKLWNPPLFQGHGKSKSYFEGWYFKVVAEDESLRLALIPGISYAADGTSHAFIQLLNGLTHQAAYHRFETDAFRAERHRFAVQIGDNFFSEKALKLALPDLQGELHFSNLHPWPRRWYAPGIMGPFTFMPFMECYHGIVSMSHQVSGQLQVGGQAVNFGQGRGYTEKDWGRSFPQAWVWMQSSHLSGDRQASLSASMARIPYLGFTFTGFIVALLWQGQLYHFATYNGSQLKSLRFEPDHIYFLISSRSYRLEVWSHYADGGELVAPKFGKMEKSLIETLGATARLRLSARRRATWEIVADTEARNMGLEAGGAIQLL